MNVAVLYSGGKDSTYAIDYCKSRGWDIRYLLSVKPTRKDCFLFHFATVEHTPKIAEMLGLKHILVPCSVADPLQEADIVKKEVEKMQKTSPVEAVILGGTGLQETQLRSVQAALQPLGIEVFAAHAGLDHADVMEEMTNKGFEFIITQVASDGLMPWLGKKITTDNLPQLLKDSVKFGFHSGGEGGYYDSLVVDCPLFTKKLEIVDAKKVVDDQYCGHMDLEVKAMPKQVVE
ncbi:diphthine--ammonia ligase [Candidatus Woesearchaeota archaeon]|nr:diphthine--ammonia ligase [Candidatus Woesearchaeota archaeon]